METGEIVALYVQMIEVALPVTITMWLCQFVTRTILKAGFVSERQSFPWLRFGQCGV